MSMQTDNIQAVYGHRRLFKSFEPYTASEIIKVYTEAKQAIRINRVLFQKSFKSFLKSTRWIFHDLGHLPYFSYRINNMIVSPYFRVSQKINARAKGAANLGHLYQHPDLIKKKQAGLLIILDKCSCLYIGDKQKIIEQSNLTSGYHLRNIPQLAYFLSRREDYLNHK